MKNLKIKKILIFTVFIIILQCTSIIKNNYIFATSSTSNNDEYDVVLFWGQSNMIGTFNELDGLQDPRYNYKDEKSVQNFSNKTGIDPNILAASSKINYVRVKQEEKTAFEYKYLTNSLKEITEGSKIIGELLKYNTKTKRLEKGDNSTYSISKSTGTNIVQQFCSTYYQKTGRKVVVVFAPRGGRSIRSYLPISDPESIHKEDMIYASMIEKYNSAIKYLNQKGYKVKNKLWVCFQGESDIGMKTYLQDYKKSFMTIANSLKKDAGIEMGSIIQNGYRIGSNLYTNVKKINYAQKQIISENENIFLGSSYPYDHHIPDRTTYYSDDFNSKVFIGKDGKKLPYEQAFKLASYSKCYTSNNETHFTSAALSQIGKETAENMALSIEKLRPKAKVDYCPLNYTKESVMVTITLNREIKPVSGWQLTQDKKALSKIFSENAKENVVFKALNGLEGNVIVNVNSINNSSKEDFQLDLETKISCKTENGKFSIHVFDERGIQEKNIKIFQFVDDNTKKELKNSDFEKISTVQKKNNRTIEYEFILSSKLIENDKISKFIVYTISDDNKKTYVQFAAKKENGLFYKSNFAPCISNIIKVNNSEIKIKLDNEGKIKNFILYDINNNGKKVINKEQINNGTYLTIDLKKLKYVNFNGGKVFKLNYEVEDYQGLTASKSFGIKI